MARGEVCGGGAVMLLSKVFKCCNGNCLEV